MRIEIRLRPGHEECAGLVQRVQAGEINITAVHDVDGTGLGEQHVQRMNVVQLAVGYVDEARDIAAQIKQRVHFHGSFRRTEVRPGEHRQAQIDGRRVQCVDSTRQLHTQTVASIEAPGLRNQPLGKRSIDPPVTGFVGIGQRGTTNRLAKAHVVELGGLRRQTRLYVAQALPVRQLGECHHPELCRA
jgi:hypothetical protein